MHLRVADEGGDGGESDESELHCGRLGGGEKKEYLGILTGSM